MTMRIIDYTVLITRSKGMASAVKEKMLSGWQPYGDLSVVNDVAFQAMVKYENPPWSLPDNFDYL